MDVEMIFDKGISFEEKALAAFRFQFNNNHIYRRFCIRLGVMFPERVTSILEIPLLPIESFKWAPVRAFEEEAELMFRSSGTGDMERSVHLVKSSEIYRKAILEGIKLLALDPSMPLYVYAPAYAENPDSSLIWMLNFLVEQSKCQESYFLPLDEQAREILLEISSRNQPMVLFGAAFGLLDLIETGGIPLPDGSVLIETGGMKTFRKEITRTELHEKLSAGFGVPTQKIISEYGMAEMLSQAYRIPGKGFVSPDILQLSVRDYRNPADSFS
jgi:hypothetical protein